MYRTLFLHRPRYLGTRSVKLFRVRMHGSESVLAVSSRSWLSYTYQSRFHLTPLSYDVLDYASGFSSEQCPEGIVAIAANTLRSLPSLFSLFIFILLPFMLENSMKHSQNKVFAYNKTTKKFLVTPYNSLKY